MAKESKKKFDWDYFLDKSKKKAVHCETRQEAEQFCRMLHEHGLKWGAKKPYVRNDRVDIGFYGMPSNFDNSIEKERMNCYSNMGLHDSVEWYNKNGVEIFRFSAYDFG